MSKIDTLRLQNVSAGSTNVAEEALSVSENVAVERHAGETVSPACYNPSQRAMIERCISFVPE